MKNFLALFLILFSSFASSEAVRLDNLNAYYQAQPVISDSLFIILHGTRGHQNLEIITSLRDSLYDNGIDSLSINLSYGIKNRENDFLPCDIEHRHTVENSLNEIERWYEYIKEKDYQNIYLIGHSRGGLDIINFYRYLNVKEQASINSIFLLAPISDNNIENAINYKKKDNIDIALINNNDKLIIDFLGCEDANVTGESFRSYYHNIGTTNILDSLATATTKVYIITASDDTVAPLSHNRIKEFIKSKNNLELYMIDGADHFFRDFYFDDLIEFILDKLDQ